MFDKIEQYKNMLLAILITVAVVGLGVSAFMYVKGLKDTIADYALTVLTKDNTIKDLNTRVVVALTNNDTLKETIKDRNDIIASQAMEIATKDEEYAKAMNTPVELRVKNKRVAEFLKDPKAIDALEALRRVSEMKYEDL